MSATKTRRISFTFNADLWDKLTSFAKKSNQSKQQVIEQATHYYLQEVVSGSI
jgi:metal-responsive CopG/Arc/MetJ family transcriptional regulator